MDKTILSQVSCVEPGQVISIRDSGRNVSKRYYWRPVDDIVSERRLREPEEVWDLLRNVVKKQMVADVPVGSFLSGGVDSSAVVAAMAVAAADRPKAFTIAIGSGKYNELNFAREVAEHFNIEHVVGHVDIAAARDLDQVPMIYDEPFADSSAIPTSKLCEYVSKGHKVALSGDGGDECFFGYPWYMTHMRRESIRNTFGQAISRKTSRLVSDVIGRIAGSSTNFRGAGFLQSLSNDSIGGFVDSQSLTFRSITRCLLSSDMHSAVADYDTADQFREVASTFDGVGIEAARLLDFYFYLPGDILTKVDRASMRHSLEVRVPFLDEEIVRFALNSSVDSMLSGGERKGLLRDATRDRLPTGIVDRKKQGFSVPLGSWMRDEVGLILNDRLSTGVISAHGLVNFELLGEMLNEHCSGRADHSLILWASLVLSESVGALV